MQLFLGAVPILFSDYSPKLEDTYYSQIIPGIICRSLLPGLQEEKQTTRHTCGGGHNCGEFAS